MPTNTTTLTISLPKNMRKQAEKQIKQRHYSTMSDYIRSLIRDDIEQGDSHLDKLLRAGIASGPSTLMTRNEWKKLHQASHARIQKS